jgi:predicted TIM-barrel fold metal-dependent hydrolase
VRSRIITPFPPPQIEVRNWWLEQVTEEAILPGLPIIDAHHHLWDRPAERYLLDEFLRDTQSGHNIVASVFIQCRSMYRSEGPEEMRPVGEVEFSNGIAAQAASGIYGKTKVAAAIVGYADLSLGKKVSEVLRAQQVAAPQRFKGVRNMTASDPSPEIAAGFGRVRPGILREKMFYEGFAQLAPLGLSADIWAYHPQLPEVIDLAKAFPETRIILNHAGGPLNVGPYRRDRERTLSEWRASMETLASLRNVDLKLGGLCMVVGGLDLHLRPRPPRSDELADLLRPVIAPCLEIFGPSRCMFESNFSMDKGMVSYPVLWNTFKKLSADLTNKARADVFAGTAARCYGIQVD